MPPPAVQQSSKRDLRFRLSLESLAIERYLPPRALANKSGVGGCTQTVPPLPQVGHLPAPGFTNVRVADGICSRQENTRTLQSEFLGHSDTAWYSSVAGCGLVEEYELYRRGEDYHDCVRHHGIRSRDLLPIRARLPRNISNKDPHSSVIANTSRQTMLTTDHQVGARSSRGGCGTGRLLPHLLGHFPFHFL